MSNGKVASGSRPRLSLRTALLLMMLVAIVLGWYSSSQRSRRRITKLSKQLMSLKAGLESDSWRSEPNDERIGREARNKGIFSHALFTRVNMQGLAIDGEFHVAEFDSCVLQDANLGGGASGFQLARFNNCNLIDAKLTGGGSAFQLSSFENSDLSGAVLTGGGSSFQRASFDGANLTDARIICPANSAAFQAVNIDGVQFQGADLSTIRKLDLESCFFDNPPTYDKDTKFPSGFDPADQLWVEVP